MSKKILIPIAEGTEEMEAVITIDLFRRAGLNVLVAGTSKEVKCSRSVKIIPDVLLEDLHNDFDLIFLPGGGLGTKNLMNSDHLKKIVLEHHKNNKQIAAICAAPLVLKEFMVIDNNSHITSHPSVRNDLLEYNYSEEKIVQDSNIFTSRGAGTAIQFALFLIEKLLDQNTSDKIAESIVY
jgi:DJ-1 family protein